MSADRCLGEAVGCLHAAEVELYDAIIAARRIGVVGGDASEAVNAVMRAGDLVRSALLDVENGRDALKKGAA